MTKKESKNEVHKLICHRSIDLKASPIGASKPISFLMTDFLASIIALTIGSCSLSAHLF